MSVRADGFWICPGCGREFARPQQAHSCQVTSLESHLEKGPPQARAIYEAVTGFLGTLGPCRVVPVKSGMVLMAATSLGGLQFRRQAVYLSFVLTRPVSDPRILRVERISPRTYSYRIRLREPVDLDDVVREWLAEAYAVGVSAGRRD